MYLERKQTIPHSRSSLMSTIVGTLLVGYCASLSGPATAAEKQPDLTSVNASIDQYQKSYGDVPSDISCDAPTIIARKLMCDSSYETTDLLWKMGRLDDMAWVYAYENGTKREVDHDDPPRDKAFIKERDACLDAQCVKAVLVRHTNDSLGGDSPYYAR